MDKEIYEELVKISADIREIQTDIKHQITRDQMENIISQRQDNFNEKISANRQHADSRIDQTNSSLNSRVDNLAQSFRALEDKLPALMGPIVSQAVKDELKDQDDRMKQARISLYTSAGVGAVFVAFGILSKTGVL